MLQNLLDLIIMSRISQHKTVEKFESGTHKICVRGTDSRAFG